MTHAVVMLCPGNGCSTVFGHVCAHNMKCLVDIGIDMARHVASQHPELIYGAAGVERMRLSQQMQARRN